MSIGDLLIQRMNQFLFLPLLNQDLGKAIEALSRPCLLSGSDSLELQSFLNNQVNVIEFRKAEGFYCEIKQGKLFIYQAKMIYRKKLDKITKEEVGEAIIKEAT